ncbi:hypothetical protein [Primorskyibacter flagellatus]|nr:hypothetical protein [Primorskyibacter flagellatus]
MDLWFATGKERINCDVARSLFEGGPVTEEWVIPDVVEVFDVGRD